MSAATVAPARAAAPPGVRLLPASGGAIRFVIEVPEPRLVPVREGGELVRLALEGYVSDGPAGSPALPERVVTVAVPAEGDVAVRVTGGERTTFEGIRLGRVPLTRRVADPRDPQAVSAALAEGEAIAERLALGDAPPADIGVPLDPPASARLLEVGWMRSQRIARIAIAPARYDVASRRLAVERRMEVEVSVPGGVAMGGPSPGTDSFEPLYRRTLLNYEQGRAWRRTPAASRDAARMAPFATRLREASVAADTTVPDTSLYAGRSWIKIAFDSTGFYRVRFATLRNLALFSNDVTTRIDSLRLFTWAGFPVLPEDGYCDECGYREVAMGFVENGDGIFGSNDPGGNDEYFYFFALGSSDWANLYDPSLPDTVFINHPYEKRNYVYLAIATAADPIGGAPARIQTEPAPPTATGGEITPATFEARLHYEFDTAQYWPDAWPNPFFRSRLFWEKWFWHTLSAGDGGFTYQPEAPGVDVTQPSRLRMRLWGVTDLPAKSAGIADHYLNAGFNSLVFPQRRWENQWAQTYDTTLVGLVQPTNALSLGIPVVTDPRPEYNAQRVDRTALAWFDLFYARRFEPVANALTFDSPPGGGTYIYDIGPFDLDVIRPPRVFDVTDPLRPIELLGAQYTAAGPPGQYQLRFKRTETGRRRYRVIPDDPAVPERQGIKQLIAPDVFMAPASSLHNLRAAPEPGKTGADYAIIYYDGFQAAADTLAAWRRARLPLHLGTGPFETAVIPISALYDQFSGGRTDPGAIRNFLRSAYYNWGTRPTFVTMLGDASADFKNIRLLAPAGLPGCLLPSYENGYVSFLQRQFATDDWMLNVNDSSVVIPDFFGGRIPAADLSQAVGFVREKLLPYERSAPLGEWRNRVLLHADDHEQGPRVDPLRWTHVKQTADLDRRMPAHADRKYVYLHTYPDGPNDTKPLAKAEIIRNLNEGVVMWNYIGHGSPFKITDESTFTEGDVGALTNRDRPAAFIAASCDVGKFDDPQFQSLGEKLAMKSDGGSIAVISSTELAFSYENSELNKVIYDRVFLRDTVPSEPTMGQYYVTLTEALLEAKINSLGSTNNQKYQLMGDAATRLNLPRSWVEVTLKDQGGATSDTLRRGSTVRFEGRVLDAPGGALQPFDGVVAMLIEDSAPVDTTFDCTFCSREPYPFRAAPMFRGDVRVTAGTFRGDFVVPLDAVLGPRGRMRGYADGAMPAASGTDGVGSVPFTLVPGSPPVGDNEGPRIALSFSGGSTSVRPDAVLRVDLSDPSGILITGHTIQNGIIVTIDDNSNTRVDITSSFRYAANSYQTGSATFQLPGLAPGPHRIRVSAADNLATGINAAQHRAAATIEFEVSEIPALEVKRAFLFPNPTSSGGAGGGGQFVVDAPGDPVNVLLNIYTVSGRLIRTLKAMGGQDQVQIPWDGLDRDGNRLASGTYLFRVQVNDRDDEGESDPRSRAVANGRFVILGR